MSNVTEHQRTQKRTKWQQNQTQRVSGHNGVGNVHKKMRWNMAIWGQSFIVMKWTKKENPDKLISKGGGKRRWVGCFGGSVVRQTRATVGHLRVSVWGRSGESGVSGEPLALPRSSWMGTETECPFYWYTQSSLSQLHHQRTQQKRRDNNISHIKHSYNVYSCHSWSPISY